MNAQRFIDKSLETVPREPDSASVTPAARSCMELLALTWRLACLAAWTALAIA